MNVKVTPPEFRWAVEDCTNPCWVEKNRRILWNGPCDLWSVLPGPKADGFMPEKIEVNLPELNWKNKNK
jgi:hypothetical protein